jgi:hypothetical protein
VCTLGKGEQADLNQFSVGVQVEVESGLVRGARQLRDETAITLDVTTVSTPEGLRDAVQSGALDIVITKHLDLTTLATIPLQMDICDGCVSPLGEITATRSIRVRNSLFSFCYVCRR